MENCSLALSYASFPLNHFFFFFSCLEHSTPLSLRLALQEVNTAGAGARILLNVSRGEGKEQRCLKKHGGEGCTGGGPKLEGAR